MERGPHRLEPRDRMADRYGPEVYLLKDPPAGSYRVRAKYYGSHQESSLTGATSAVVWALRGGGRPELRFDTVRLDLGKQTMDVMTVAVEGETAALEFTEEVEEPQAAAETAPEPVAEEVVEELQAAAQAPPEPAAEAYSQVEEETFKELRILENLADAHEDITKREIKALEQLAGSKEGNKLMLGLREAGARLREKVDAEFREMRRREAALLNSITATADEIAKVEKEEPLPMKASKAIKELRMLEQLAHAYEDTTAEEIKALEQFAKEDQS